MRRSAGHAWRARQTVQIGRQIKVIAHFEPRVVIDVVDALRPAEPERPDASPRQIIGMDMVGVDVVCGLQHWRAFEQASTRRAALAVGRVDARNAQDHAAHTGCPPVVPHPAFSVNSPCSPCCICTNSSVFSSNITFAVAIDAAGGPVDVRHWCRAQAKGGIERTGAWVARALARWRCQMHHARGNAGQSAQRARRIQIAQQRRDAVLAQCIHAVW